jgi:DNA topoisomerase-1
MSKNLLIVESPAKAKTIEKILGKDFTVKSSYGHVRDLERGNGAVDIQNKFNPKYVITPEKQKVVKELKSWVKKVDEVWLATDEDREGEAISWHLCEVLKLDPRHTKRIVFREITAPAIKKAITTPRSVDLNLVNAQQARRILDRLVGYELSEILWRKVKGKLSAGSRMPTSQRRASFHGSTSRPKASPRKSLLPATRAWLASHSFWGEKPQRAAPWCNPPGTATD